MNPIEHERANANAESVDVVAEQARQPNRDPLTNEPGAHMVGTSLGATAGGLAGAMAGMAASAATGVAAGTVMGGPIGGAVGLVAGAVVGGMLGSAAGEALNPTEETLHWSSTYTKEPYYNSDYAYDDYSPAYRTGAEGFDNHPDRTFDEIESHLQDEYILNRGRSRLGWDDARPAMLAAWERRRQFRSRG